MSREIVVRSTQACEVCWTNSWVPVPDNDPDAQKLLHQAGSVRCDHCWLQERYRELEQKIERLLAQEREKVRVRFELALLPRKDEADVKYAEASAVDRAGYEHGRSDGLAIAVEVIRQLDLTQPKSDLAASSGEKGKHEE